MTRERRPLFPLKADVGPRQRETRARPLSHEGEAPGEAAREAPGEAQGEARGEGRARRRDSRVVIADSCDEQRAQ
jgi:hypothetical protein